MFAYFALTALLIPCFSSYQLCGNKVIRDGKGLSWMNYCTNQGASMLFYKDYAEYWTFVTNQDIGDQNFAYRVPYDASLCNGIDVDIDGYVWDNWCTFNGKQIKFQKSKGQFVIDKLAGEERFGWRKVLFENLTFSSFLQITGEMKKCMELEGDTSGRYFPVEYDVEGERVKYEKNALGNFIIDLTDKSRVTRQTVKNLQKIGDLPLCACENLFEVDPSLAFYWIIEFTNDLPVVFLESPENYYLINPESGHRQIHI